MVACTPRKVTKHVTSDFDLYEVDLDVQMNFLHAAPWSAIHLILHKVSECHKAGMKASIILSVNSQMIHYTDVA